MCDGYSTVPYRTVLYFTTSASAETTSASAAPGDLAGGINRLKKKKLIRSLMERVEVDGGNSVCAGTGKVEIRRGTVFGGFSAGKRRLLLLGGREVAN